MNPFRTHDISKTLEQIIACKVLADQYEWGYSPSKSDLYYSMACGAYLPYAQTVMQCFVDLGGMEKAEDSLGMYTSSCQKISSFNRSIDEVISQFYNGTKYLVDIPLDLNYVPVKFDAELLFENYEFFHFIYRNFDYAYDASLLINSLIWALIFLLGLQKHFNSNWIRKLRSAFTHTISRTHHNETKLFNFYLTLLPTKGEACILVSILLINVLTSCIYYPLRAAGNGEGKLVFLIKCMANRTGGLAFGHLPLTIMLAGRNNIIQHLTGLPYSSMIFYHKWAARMVWIYGTIHGVLWMSYYVWKDPQLLISYVSSDPLWMWGVGAIILVISILLTSVYSWRSRRYEIFLTLHIGLAATFIYACFKHCESLGWLGWIYISTALWLADRILRIIRIIKFGGFKHAYAKVVDTENAIFQITIPNSYSFKFFPGCYGFLYIWNTKLPFRGHPFTLMRNNEVIEILVKVKGGITMELYQKIPQNGTKIPIRVALEGPYGHEAPVAEFSHTLLIASGTALAGPISYLNSMEKTHSSHLIWITTNEKLFQQQTFLMDLLSELKVNVDIYVTRPSGVSISWLPENINIHRGRPDLEKVISEDLKNWNKSAVVCCALPVIDDKVRDIVADEMLVRDIYFHDELQVW